MRLAVRLPENYDRFSTPLRMSQEKYTSLLLSNNSNSVEYINCPTKLKNSKNTGII